MRGSRFRRSLSGTPGSMAAWMSLLFIIVALIVVMLTRDQLGTAAASCYTDISAVQKDNASTGPQMTEPEETPNIQVAPPPQKGE